MIVWLDNPEAVMMEHPTWKSHWDHEWEHIESGITLAYRAHMGLITRVWDKTNDLVLCE